MLTLSQSDIDAIADAVALRLRGEAVKTSTEQPVYDAAKAKRLQEFRLLGYEVGRASKGQGRKTKRTKNEDNN